MFRPPTWRGAGCGSGFVGQRPLLPPVLKAPLSHPRMMVKQNVLKMDEAALTPPIWHSLLETQHEPNPWFFFRLVFLFRKELG